MAHESSLGHLVITYRLQGLMHPFLTLIQSCYHALLSLHKRQWLFVLIFMHMYITFIVLLRLTCAWSECNHIYLSIYIYISIYSGYPWQVLFLDILIMFRELDYLHSLCQGVKTRDKNSLFQRKIIFVSNPSDNTLFKIQRGTNLYSTFFSIAS